MSKNNSASTNAGIGFTGMLAILFIGLKLTKMVTWSWIWVLSPLWIPAVAVLGILLIVFLFAILKGLLK